MAAPIRSVDRTTLLAHLGTWSVGNGPLYIRLANAIAAAIERGDISPGTRLPAERPLGRSLAVSRGTVMSAYERLRELHLAESRQGSGTWIRLDATRPLDLLNDTDTRSRQLFARLLEDTRGVIDLTLAAVSSLDDLPEELFTTAPRETLQRLGAGHGYLPLGLPALRQRIAGYYTHRDTATATEQVIVTSGAQQAISLIAQLIIRPGDAVIVESPTYPGAVDAFSRAGARLVAIPPATDWSSVARLNAAISANAPRLVYLMPGGHNPLGTITIEQRRREIAATVDAHETFLVEDNILADLAFDGRSIPPIAAFTHSNRVITLGSLSKVGWGGLRVGWLRGPAELVDRVARLKAAADFGTSVQAQVTACAFLDRLDHISVTRRATLSSQAEALQLELGHLLPSWTWTQPEGGLALWVRLPHGDADAFKQHAVRHGVDFTPGSAMCADGEHLDSLRLAFSEPPDVLREGAKRLSRAWLSYASTSMPTARPLRAARPRVADGA